MGCILNCFKKKVKMVPDPPNEPKELIKVPAVNTLDLGMDLKEDINEDIQKNIGKDIEKEYSNQVYLRTG